MWVSIITQSTKMGKLIKVHSHANSCDTHFFKHASAYQLGTWIIQLTT